MVVPALAMAKVLNRIKDEEQRQVWEGSWHNSLQRGLLESKTLTATMGLDEEGSIRQEQ